MPFLCEECNNLGARLIFGLDIRLCKDCKQLIKYRLISKTHALKDYGLKLSDIQNTNYKEVGNPLFRGANNMILFKEQDILNIFLNKYNKIISIENKEILENPEPNLEYKNIVKDILNYYKDNKSNIKLVEKKYNF
jgi:hypothetical protein